MGSRKVHLSEIPRASKTRWILLLSALAVVVVSQLPLWGANLWKDHNPYGAFGSLKAGSILKIVVDEAVVVTYEFDRQSDKKSKIKMAPDKNVTKFLPKFSSDKTSSGTDQIKVRAQGRIKVKLAVLVGEVSADGTLSFSGTRVLTYENGRASHQIQVAGQVHRSDVSNKREVKSGDIANLQIVMSGAPTVQSKGIPMKTVPGTGPGAPPIPSAKLSPAEQQRLLLEYINRILGDTSDR